MERRRGVVRASDDNSWLLAFSDLVLLLLVFLFFGLTLARQPQVRQVEKQAPVPARHELSLAQLVGPVNILPPLPGRLGAKRGVSGLREARRFEERRLAGASRGPAKTVELVRPDAAKGASSSAASAVGAIHKKSEPPGVEEKTPALPVVARGKRGTGPPGGNTLLASNKGVKPVSRNGDVNLVARPPVKAAREVPSTAGRQAASRRAPEIPRNLKGKVLRASLNGSTPFITGLSYRGEKPDELLITLLDTVGFASGSADLLPGAMPLLSEVRSFAAGHPELAIEVSGHTDNVPIRSDRYPSNWELASARALAVAHFLLATGEVAPCRVSARGYGEYRPVASNLSPEGRARNRRVEIRFYRSRGSCTTEAAMAESRN